jgi:quercetin dioxygenase-like cupin family protein
MICEGPILEGQAVVLAGGEVFLPNERKHMLSKDGIEELEGELLKIPGSTECNLPLEHLFQPGIYIRRITMPTGQFIIGAEHTEKHFNIVLSGRCSIICDGRVMELKGGDMFLSEANVRKVLQIHETTVWLTLHENPANETDIVSLESRLCRMSETHKKHFEGMRPLAEEITEST